jgi:hypothetical protein
LETDNRDDAEELFMALWIIREASYEYGSGELTTILAQLTDTARDAVQGVRHKWEMPSVEAVRSAAAIQRQTIE